MRPELARERLWASGAARAELVLLHGWGSSRDCWRPLLTFVRPWANVTLLDLPGLGGTAAEGGDSRNTPEGQEPLEGAATAAAQAHAHTQASALAAAVVEACPDGAVLVGWSLGGQIATLAAALAPARIRALVTLASNPHFSACEHWPGVAPADLEHMAGTYRDSPARSLARFEALQALGEPAAADLRRQLASCRGSGAAGAGLTWLAQLDTRATLAQLPQPQLHLLAARDSLVPHALATALAEHLAGAAVAQVRCLPAGGHALPLQQPQRIATELEAFMTQHALLMSGAETGAEAGAGAPPPLDKRAIAASFSRAASSYDSVAALQREVGERLLQRLPARLSSPSASPSPSHSSAHSSDVATVLDLGCGTGYFQRALCERFPDARYIGLDLATGMLDYARRQHGADHAWVAGDAEQLPLAANSVDLIFSSLAIQWCQRPVALFAELERVLRPGGLCLFSTLGPATLQELRSAWAAVDSARHVNDFLPAAALQQAAGPALQLERETLCLRYRRLRQLFDELKGIGAHNVHSQRPAGLGGRRALAGMMDAYEAWRSDGLLPATYEVFYGVLARRGECRRERAA
ncbi:malonyl-ACP O-methyltransferase BioC [Parahaliea mediterranea]|uniref:malonyl-ACP O-methyltransferase BioC n=1 Tax=Parahaliea mediterranea TaxID=651086 RepID=UPI000E2F2FA0|nr:malonyl-ACP O-methyltransferase BioC [Parahaliea mediterranea]